MSIWPRSISPPQCVWCGRAIGMNHSPRLQQGPAGVTVFELTARSLWRSEHDGAVFSVWMCVNRPCCRCLPREMCKSKHRVGSGHGPLRSLQVFLCARSVQRTSEMDVRGNQKFSLPLHFFCLGFFFPAGCDRGVDKIAATKVLAQKKKRHLS